MIDMMSPIIDLTLGLMGFLIGGELKTSVFRRFGLQMIVIMFAEGLMAFGLVAALVTWWSGNLALGVILGALAAATAPAGTVDVLWEYKSRGPLTTTILGIVALDDSLSLILFGFSIAFAQALLEGGTISWVTGVGKPLLEILGSLALGALVGLILSRLLRFIQNRDDMVVVMLGAVFFISGLSSWLGLSLILAEMAFGVALVNLAPQGSRTAFKWIQEFTPPIYILFFILVGARLEIGLLPQMGLIGLLYLLGRTAGKMLGAWLGGTASHATSAVRNYLGMTLFSQAGVAVGLALATAQAFSQSTPEAQRVGALVVNIITVTTFLVQVIGPPLVKLAISRAGEIPGSEEEATHASP